MCRATRSHALATIGAAGALAGLLLGLGAGCRDAGCGAEGPEPAAAARGDDGPAEALPDPVEVPLADDAPELGEWPDRSDLAALRQPWDNFRPHEPLRLRVPPHLQRQLEQYEEDFTRTLLSRGVVTFELVHAFYLKGWLSREDREAQVERFMAFIEEHPDEPLYKVNLVVALAHVGFEEAAIELAERWHDEPWFQKRWDPNFFVGALLFRRGRYEESIPYLERALAVDDRAWTRLWLRLALEQRGTAEAKARQEELFPFGEHLGPDDPALFPFEDRADAWGIGRWGLAGSVAFQDFDGDELLDLLLTATYYAPERYRLDPSTGYQRVDDETLAGISHVTPSVLAVDFDNDGWNDVFLASAAWFGAGPNRVLRNDEGEGFTDVGDRGDARLEMQNTTGLAALDFDRDGLVDVATTGIAGGQTRLLRNTGDFVFEEVTEAAGIAPRDTLAIHLTAGDVNGDGWPDLFVNSFGDNCLYINQGDGTFVDEAAARGVAKGSPRGFGTWMFDMDSDGDLDIVASQFAMFEAFERGFAEFPAESFMEPRPEEGDFRRSAVFENQGDGHFVQLGEEAGIIPASVMGAQFIDMDLDGYPDIVLGPGSHPLENMQPLLVYRNEGDNTFTNVTPISNPRYYGKFHGMAFADVDRDGDPDLYVNNGGVLLSDHWRDLFLENTTTGKHWLHLRLVGTESNRSAIGARVQVHVGDRALTQEVAAGQGFGATNSPYLIFGLGDAEAVERVHIRWPSGAERTLDPLVADQALVVTEGEEALRRVY